MIRREYKIDNNEIELLIKQREEIKQSVDFHSKKINNEFPSLMNGLLLANEIKDLCSYKFHKNEYEKSFKVLRDFDGKLTNKQKKEMINYKRLKEIEYWINYQ